MLTAATFIGEVTKQVLIKVLKSFKANLYFQTILIWLISFGAKITSQFISLHPTYFLVSIFSPFMVSRDVQNDGQIKTMAISTKWTWINLTLSIIGSVSGSIAYYLGMGRNPFDEAQSKYFYEAFDSLGSHVDSFMNSMAPDFITQLFEEHYFNGGIYSGIVAYIIITFLPFVIVAICLALFFFSEKFCSSCCKINLPIVNKTGVDINDFSKIIDLQTGQKYGSNEDEEPNTQQPEPIAPSVFENRRHWKHQINTMIVQTDCRIFVTGPIRKS